MSDPHLPEAIQVSAAESRRDKVYSELRRRILAGEFSTHSRLAENRIGKMLGVSRTPVREALLRLHGDGLVQRADGGYFPVQPDFSDLSELYELRLLLEQHGIRRAGHGKGHDLDALAELRDAWAAMASEQPEPDPDFVKMDEDFHLTLLRASGNQVLADHLDSVNLRIRSVRMYDFLTADRIEWTISTHLEIVETVIAGELAEAAELMQAHIAESMRVVEERATAALRQMVFPARDDVPPSGRQP